MSNGFQNETELCNALNNYMFHQLNSNLKNMIKFIVPDIKKSDIIVASQKGGTSKGDLSLLINGRTYYLSIKKGSGNSVHQEPLEEFIDFIKQNFIANEETCNAFRFYIWGDGTLDGKGSINDRMGSTEIKEKFPDIINKIQFFFDNNKEELINRFVLSGSNKSNNTADYLYYGTVDKGKILSNSDVIRINMSAKNNPPSIGELTFQAWNRRLTYKENQENRRGQIQLKWGRLSKT